MLIFPGVNSHEPDITLYREMTNIVRNLREFQDLAVDLCKNIKREILLCRILPLLTRDKPQPFILQSEKVENKNPFGQTFPKWYSARSC